MTDTLARPALTLAGGTPDPDGDPFIPSLATALLGAGWPPSDAPRIASWLGLPAPVDAELVTAMGCGPVLASLP